MSETIKIEEVFDLHFIQLLQLVPRNPYVRALVLKLSGKMPAEDCQTFEQVKQWVETHCQKRKRPSQHRGGGISIHVEFSEMEYGTAKYSVDRSGTDTFEIDAGDMYEIIQGAIRDGEGVDEIVDQIAERIDEDAWNQCEPDMDNYGEYDYVDWDSTDCDNQKLDYSKTEIRNAVLNFVSAHHPDLAAEL